jgi:hypothetical protein
LENAILVGANIVIEDLLLSPDSRPQALIAFINVAFSYIPAAIVRTSRFPEAVVFTAGPEAGEELSGVVIGPVS